MNQKLPIFYSLMILTLNHNYAQVSNYIERLSAQTYSYGYDVEQAQDSIAYYYTGLNSLTNNAYETYLSPFKDTLSAFVTLPYKSYLIEKCDIENDPIGKQYFTQQLVCDSAVHFSKDVELWYRSSRENYFWEENSLLHHSAYDWNGLTYKIEDSLSNQLNQSNQILITKYFERDEENDLLIPQPFTDHYTYQNNLLVKKIRITTSPNLEDSSYFITSYVYDPNNKLIQQISQYQNFDDDTLINLEQFTFTYNNDLLIEQQELDWNGTTWQFDRTIQISYNKRKPNFIVYTTFSYDPLNNLTATYTYECNYYYSVNGNIDSIIKIDNYLDFNNLYKEIFSYNTKGELIQYYFTGDPNFAGYTTNYQYDQQHNCISEITIPENGNEGLTTQITYSYTAQGNLASEAGGYYSELLEEYIYTNLHKYYYDKIELAGSLTNTIVISVYPSPANSTFNIKVLGSTVPVGINIKTIDGKLIYQTDLNDISQSIITIDCSKWSPGVYLVTASDKLNYSYQKVVIN